MLTYFIEGGVLFMGMLSVVLLIILVLAIKNAVVIFSKRENDVSKMNSQITYIKSAGLFGLVLGMLGQFIGLFQAFNVISKGMNISPAVLAGGLKVSSITTIYGMIIFLVSYLLWFGLNILLKKSNT